MFRVFFKLSHEILIFHTAFWDFKMVLIYFLVFRIIWFFIKYLNYLIHYWCTQSYLVLLFSEVFIFIYK